MKYLTANAEALFEPKQVYSSLDWLASHKEPGQTPTEYRNSPKVRWCSEEKNCIFLFLIDNSIDQESAHQFQLYTSAYFHGLEVKVIKGGDEIPYQTEQGETQVLNVPKDFIKHHNITTRER